jgi:hypothetical protein
MFDATMLSYFLVAVAASIGIVVVDDDPTSVSTEEWILFAVLIYAAISFLRLYVEAKLNKPRR